jgi:hypothetical protein
MNYCLCGYILNVLSGFRVCHLQSSIYQVSWEGLNTCSHFILTAILKCKYNQNLHFIGEAPRSRQVKSHAQGHIVVSDGSAAVRQDLLDCQLWLKTLKLTVTLATVQAAGEARQTLQVSSLKPSVLGKDWFGRQELWVCQSYSYIN